MQPNIDSQPVKWVPQLTERARLAIKDKATTISRKQKASNNSTAGATVAVAAVQNILTAMPVVKKTRPAPNYEGTVDTWLHATTQQGRCDVVKSEEEEDALPANPVENESGGWDAHSPSSNEAEGPKETAKEELSMWNVRLKLQIN